MSVKNFTSDFSRITLGTVQFGLGYGVSNSDGRPDINIVERILDESRSVGIRTLDTAPGYGDAESILGYLGVSDFKVLTKIPSISAYEHDVESIIRYSVDQSLARLNVPHLYGILLHDASNVDHPHSSRIIDCLVNLRETGVVENIGVSSYRPEHVDRLDLLQRIDFIQAPVNVLDRRFVDSGFANRNAANSVNLYARSVFLQGLLLMPLERLPNYFEKHMPLFTEWHRLLEANYQDAMSVCLSFVRSCASIDQILLGVQSVEQLKEILEKYSSVVDLYQYNSIVSADEALINPTEWKL